MTRRNSSPLPTRLAYVDGHCKPFAAEGDTRLVKAIHQSPARTRKLTSRRRREVSRVARLPDVSEHLPASPRPARRRGRIRRLSVRSAGRGRRRRSLARSRLGTSRTFSNDRRGATIARALRAPVADPARSDPFSIPSTSLHERLAPVARFLMLFLLFTAVGTTTLMIERPRTANRRDDSLATAPTAPATAASHQRLEPAPNGDEPADRLAHGDRSARRESEGRQSRQPPIAIRTRTAAGRLPSRDWPPPTAIRCRKCRRRSRVRIGRSGPAADDCRHD